MDEVQKIIANCKHVLPSHGPQKPMAQTLQELADSLNGNELPDQYGEGDYLAKFEAEIATMFGKESAMFLHINAVQKTPKSPKRAHWLPLQS